jgi:hypothetical protein
LIDMETIKRQSLLVAVCDDVATADTSSQLAAVAHACAALLGQSVLAMTERYWGRSGDGVP